MNVMAIDQSLNGSAFCVMEDGDVKLLETLKQDSEQGLQRLLNITGRTVQIINQFHPKIVVMEDYSGSHNMNTMIPNVEVGGCIKMTMHSLGYKLGREALAADEPTFIVW